MFGWDLDIPEFHEKLECRNQKSKLYVKLADDMAKARFAGTPDQIIIKI